MIYNDFRCDMIAEKRRLLLRQVTSRSECQVQRNWRQVTVRKSSGKEIRNDVFGIYQE